MFSFMMQYIVLASRSILTWGMSLIRPLKQALFEVS